MNENQYFVRIYEKRHKKRPKVYKKYEKTLKRVLKYVGFFVIIVII